MNPTLETLTLIQDDVRWAIQELQHTDLFIAGVSVVGGLLLIQLLLAFWTLRRLSELGHMRERMSRLFDGLALLTDTTETGMATMAAQLDKVTAKRSTARSARSKVVKRVVAAADKGRKVAEIARDESMSEGEVHLHLKLAEAMNNLKPGAAA